MKSPNLAKWLIASLISTSLILVAGPATASVGGNGVCSNTSFSGGSGTSADPYLITTTNGMKELADCWNQSWHYELGSNIDLETDQANPWTPIAPSEFDGFVGKLDGAGYSITGLYADATEAGLFANLSPGASISNLNISDARVFGSVAGILSAKALEGVELENLTVSGVVTGLGSSFNQTTAIGGIIGRLAWRGSTWTQVPLTVVQNVNFQGAVIDESGVGVVMGGLFGSIGNFDANVSAQVEVRSSSARVTLSALAHGNMGGIAGDIFNTKILESDAFISAELYRKSATSFEFGGIAGVAIEAEIDSSFAGGQVFAASAINIGGLVSNLRPEFNSDTPRFLTSLIRNSLTNLTVVTLEGSGSQFGGIVRYSQGGTLQNNVNLSTLHGFEAANSSGVVASLQSSRTHVLSGNVFNTSGTNLSSAQSGVSLPSNEATGLSSSSLSQVAVLNALGFDTANEWLVSGQPSLRAITSSAQMLHPMALAMSTGDEIRISFGEEFDASPLPNVSDFTVTAGGSAVNVLSVTLDPQKRHLGLNLSQAIDPLERVVVTYTPGTTPPNDIILSNRPGFVAVGGFTVNAINAVPYSVPIPTPGSVTPVLIPSYTASEILFQGTGLADATIQVATGSSFGAVKVVSRSETEVRFLAPTRANTTALTAAKIQVTGRGGKVVIDPGFSYLARPSISAVTPAIGGFGSIVDIVGVNLSSATTVSFGATPVPVTATSATSVSAIAPQGTPGLLVLVKVEGPGWTSTLNGAFRFTQSPSLSALSTYSGSTAGGESLSLSGVTLSDLVSVTFGGLTANIISSSSTEIFVSTPPSPAGVVDVVVRTAGGTSTLASAFTFIAPPQPASSPPSSAPRSGGGPEMTLNTPEITTFSTRELPTTGGQITAEGRRLADISSMTLGGIRVTIVSNTDTSVTFTVLEMPVGTWDLRLVGANGTLTFQQAITIVGQEVALESTTGSMLGFTMTLRFTGNNRTLNVVQERNLSSRLDRFSNAETIICWGYTTAANPNAWAIAHATARAKAACDFAVASDSDLKTVVRLRYGVSKDFAMRAALQFWR